MMVRIQSFLNNGGNRRSNKSTIFSLSLGCWILLSICWIGMQRRGCAHGMLLVGPTTSRKTSLVTFLPSSRSSSKNHFGIQHHRHFMTKQAPSSLVEKNSNVQEESVATTATRFTTPEMQVYIEDTDAYGVIYNANYLRIYDRALHVAGMLFQNKNDIDEDEENHVVVSGGSSSVILSSSDDDSWSILEVHEQKFKSSPELGGSFVVVGELILPPPSMDDHQSSSSSDHGDDTEEWDLTIQSSSSSSSSDSSEDIVVYNTARLVIGHPNSRHHHRSVSSEGWSLPPVIKKSSKDKVSRTTRLDTYMPYRDEFDAHMPGVLPLRNVLNLFERSRTNYLGGPNSLRALQQEDDILFVVTSIRDLALVHHSSSSSSRHHDGGGYRAGDQVGVETNFIAKKNGMVIECWQRLVLLSDDADTDDDDHDNDDESQDSLSSSSSVVTTTTGNKRTLLARGVVTIMVLNGSTRRPTSKLPLRLKEMMGLVN